MSTISNIKGKGRIMFPEVRLRRLRQSNGIRRMLSTPLPGPEKLIWPTFVIPGENRREPIESMPGQARLSTDKLLIELAPLVQNGLGGVLLFGLADTGEKDSHGSAAYATHGTVQEAIRAVKEAFPQLVVIADVCVCAYTNHGHCGPLNSTGGVDNDASLSILEKVACSMAAAGADIVAPSAMMDGQVIAIRKALDAADYTQTLIMSISTKFASSLYSPFRDAEKSSPGEGDRNGYQAAPGDLRTALRESKFDEDEGADILMLKPALFYLDILSHLRANTDLPLAVYNVSGEYAMIHATADRGWGDLKAMVRESMIALSRSGADLIITYWANQYEQLLQD